MKEILSYATFCASFAMIVYCMLLGSSVSSWMIFTACGLLLAGAILDILIYKEEKNVIDRKKRRAI